MEPLYSKEFVLERYGITLNTLYDLVKNGELHPFKPGYRFFESDLERFENRNRKNKKVELL